MSAKFTDPFSAHGSQHPMAMPTLSKKVLMDAGDDEEYGDEDFTDVKYELLTRAHHLTSVLINPRESLFDDLFDEFANEQSTPLEYQSPLVASSGSLFGSSQHSTHFSLHSPNAGGQSLHRSAHSGHGSSHSTSPLISLTLTQTELQQIEKLVVKLQKLSKIFLSAHHTYSLNTNSVSQHSISIHHHHPSLSAPHSSPPATTSSAFRSKRLAADDLRLCYREVPDMFFKAEFSLQNSEFFGQTLALLDTRPPNSPRLTGYTINPEELSQDRLSLYLDLVEVALLRQIWSRSPAFFRALDDLKGMQHVVGESINHLRHIRDQLVSVDGHHLQALEIPKLQRRQKNSNVLHSKLVHVQHVLQGRNLLLQLLEVEDYFSAQQLIVGIRKVYQEHCLHIQCLRSVGDQLSDIEAGISDVMCNKFVTVGIQWEAGLEGDEGASDKNSAADFLNELDQYTTLANSTSGSGSAQLLREEELASLLASLIDHNRLEHAMQMYRSRLLDGVKLVIRTCVMEYLHNFDISLLALDADGELQADADSSIPYIQRVRDMSGDNFLACLSMCFEHIVISLRKAHVFHSSICAQIGPSQTDAGLDLEEEFRFSTPSTPTPTPSSGDLSAKVDKEAVEALLAHSLHCVQAACDVAQKSMAQLINMRKENNSKLPYAAMKQLSELSSSFIASIEKYNSNTSAFALRQCLLIQFKLFCEHIHDQYKTQLVNTLDAERWVQCDVSPERQKEINRLTSGKAFLQLLQTSFPVAAASASLALPTGGTTAGPAAALATAGMSSLSSVDDGSQKRKDKDTRPVVIDDAEFRVTWSVLLLAEVVMTYLDIAYHFAPVVTEVIHKIVELVRLFNTRTKQLVLGAQAIQSAARLKSITAKHLATTAQSLSFFIVLVPHIRAALLAQIPAKHQLLLTELDRISQELFDHHHQIINKFVTIVHDVLENSALKLKTVDWDRFQHGTTCEYFEEVQRNVLTLHKVLNAVLPPEQLHDVFLRIFNLLNRKVPAHFEEVMPSTVTGKQRILDEMTHLVISLSKLKHVDTSVLTVQLEDHFRKKYAR